MSIWGWLLSTHIQSTITGGPLLLTEVSHCPLPDTCSNVQGAGIQARTANVQTWGEIPHKIDQLDNKGAMQGGLLSEVLPSCWNTPLNMI